jgi:hypothetical protein
MKKIRNIVPIPADGVVVDPGTIWEEDSIGLFIAEGFASVNYGQASDRRLFEPVEERFIRNGEPCRVITATGEVCDLHFWDTCLGDAQRFAFGNVFRVDTSLNAHGVHIDDALKVFKLALRVPKLWECLKWLWDPKSYVGDKPIPYKDCRVINEIIREIEDASQSGDCK